MAKSKKGFKNSLAIAKWAVDSSATTISYEDKKAELNASGGFDSATYNDLLSSIDTTEKQYKQMLEVKENANKHKKSAEAIKKEIIGVKQDITALRETFLRGHFTDDARIKVSISALRDGFNFEDSLRAILQRDSSFDEDFNALRKYLLKGRSAVNLESIKMELGKVRNGDESTLVGAKFKNLVRAINDEQFDKIEILFPEDEINVQYKKEGSSTYTCLLYTSDAADE